jgi:hypothetical protein
MVILSLLLIQADASGTRVEHHFFLLAGQRQSLDLDHLFAGFLFDVGRRSAARAARQQQVKHHFASRALNESRRFGQKLAIGIP